MTTNFTSQLNLKRTSGLVLMIFLFIQNGTAQNIYIRWTGINGSSLVVTPDKSKLIEVLSYSTGMAVASNIGTGGIVSGKPSESQLSFMTTDRGAVTQLKTLLLNETRNRNQTVWFIFNKPGGSIAGAISPTNDFYLIGLTNCAVNEIQESAASGGGGITFSLSLSYTQITYYSRTQSPNGTLGTTVTSSWDFQLNKSVAAQTPPSNY
jgi:type VI protein secretion system component Hcp